MNYRSFSDLAQVIRANAAILPDDVDLVVGVPRSGIAPASMIALSKNVDFTDLESYLLNRPLAHGRTRRTSAPGLNSPFDAKHTLVIDDSVHTGGTIKGIRSRIAKVNPLGKISYGVIYAAKSLPDVIDLHFEILAGPRAFEWNALHLPIVETFCLDIDGVLCRDPSDSENDDGEAYREFLLTVAPQVVPTHVVGHLVTSRLEKFRSETERWLHEKGIRYKKLHMLDLPDAETRRRLGTHASFKARVYRSLSKSRFFIESEPHQAQKIAKLSGKPVLCYQNQVIYRPIPNAAYAGDVLDSFVKRAGQKVRRTLFP
ncbi:phosphoribosyltransferase family protein [Henriciella sp.]|uniref:phosphoribosyltransferase family protein n=1 Tax=Henriciella sp. TaxID=1968823 RepID=UPI0025C4600D|nr:phosphoribosyltransferase family protein [Henriciella sp.]